MDIAFLDPVQMALVSGGVSFLAALIFTPLVIRGAHRMNWVARPKEDRWHEQPTALMGGIAIFAASTLGVLLFFRQPLLLPVWGGAAIMFFTGLVDDLKGLKPAAKLLAQVVATTLLLYAGYAFGKGGPFWLSIPLTFLWVIGITNAVNLLDNMDGLAVGTAAIATGVLAVFSIVTGNIVGVEAMLAVAGAAVGFLIFNFKPARIFMGDSGSLFLGYAIAAFALIIQAQVSGRQGLAIYLVSAAVLAVPIFDTTLVTIVRTLSGRAVSQGGRDHSSHRLVFLGLSERRAVVMLYGISLVFGGLALLFHFAEVKLFYALGTFFLVGLGVFGLHLGSVDVYDDDGEGRGVSLVERTLPEEAAAVMRAFMGRNWKSILCVVADLLLVAAAFVLAHYLRFERGLSVEREAALMDMLPGVVGIKLLTLYGAGLHRGMWRHAGTPELVKVVKASTLSSVLAYAVFVVPYGAGFLSEAVFFIDWMIVTLSVAGIRFGFRGIRQYFSTKRDHGRRVLLYGAGDAGLIMLRELRRNKGYGMTPVGFIDDDPRKEGLTAQGVSVLGTFHDLEDICKLHQVDEVLITSRQISEARKMEILEACEHVPVKCRTSDFSIRPVMTSGDGEAFPVSMQ